MKRKTIKAILRKKFDKWTATIKDEGLRDRVRDNSIITGGAITSMLMNEPVNDFDIYFRDFDTALAVAIHYVDAFGSTVNTPRGEEEIKVGSRDPIDGTEERRIKIHIPSAGIASVGNDEDYVFFETDPNAESEAATQYIEAAKAGAEKEKEGNEYKPIFLSANAITLSGKIQLVVRFYGEADAIHENYDFHHCTSYWQSWDSHLELRPAAMEAILAKELRYQGSKYPLCSIIRTRKFIGRGWHINAGQYLKMCMQLNALDLTSFEVLEEQLTGVDTAYFHELLNKVREHDPTGVDTCYLLELVDKIF